MGEHTQTTNTASSKHEIPFRINAGNVIKKPAKDDFDLYGSLCPWLFSTSSSCLSPLFCSLNALVELLQCYVNAESKLQIIGKT